MKKAISQFEEKKILETVQASARTILSTLSDLEYTEPTREPRLKSIREYAVSILDHAQELLK